MAKKINTPVKPANPFAKLEVVTVKDLVAHFNLDGKKIRAIIRLTGQRAPATGLEGMGPQAKYEWAPDSPKLAKAIEAIEKFLADSAENDK